MDIRTYVECQSIRRRGKSNLCTLGEVKDVTRLSSDFLTGLVGDLEFALEDDLHFVVGVLVDEWGAFF